MQEGGADGPLKDIPKSEKIPKQASSAEKKTGKVGKKVPIPIQHSSSGTPSEGLEDILSLSPGENTKHAFGGSVQDALAATSQDAPGVDGTNKTEADEVDEFVYKGIRIRGVEGVEKAGMVKREDVTALLDRLPEGYFKYVPLDAITFEPYKLFSIERDGELMAVKESDLLPTDTVNRRIKGATKWNSKLENGNAVPTDGQMYIQIFSLEDFEDKPADLSDKDLELYVLTHELGHTLWGLMEYTPGIYAELKRREIPLPREESTIKFAALTTAWRELPESTLERYKEYKPAFVKENDMHETGKTHIDLTDKIAEEDFAISHEYYLHWKNLEQLDSARFGLIDVAYEVMGTPIPATK